MRAVALMLGLAWGALSFGQAQTLEELEEKANAAMEKENYTQALGFYDAALRLKPKNPQLLGNRGKCYAGLGRFEEALRDLDKAIERQLIEDGYWETPEICALYFEKAFAYDRMTRHAEAVPLYEKVIALDKTFPYAHNNLAWILASSHDASLRNPDRAIELVKVELERTQWKDAASLDTLAGAYAAKGLFDEAVQTMDKAMVLDLSEPDKKEFEEHLEMFRNRKPFVQSKKEPLPPVGSPAGENQAR